MKKIIFIIFLCITFWQCDKINPPYLENPTDLDTSDYTQKILLEEYTGFRCGNCPEATEIAHNLKERYPNNLILLAVHSGGYAKPTTAHPYDFRTPIGDDLDNFFGCSKAGNPNGMVNRVGFPTKSHILREGQWEAVIQELLKQKPKLNLKLSTSFNPTNRTITATVEINFLEASLPNYYLCLYLAEDSVVQYQRDDRKNPPDIENYVHNNVLRDGLTPTWGIQISESSLSPETKIVKEIRYTIPDGKDWRIPKLKVIAFVHDKDNTFEILQVDESYISP